MNKLNLYKRKIKKLSALDYDSKKADGLLNEMDELWKNFTREEQRSIADWIEKNITTLKKN